MYNLTLYFSGEYDRRLSELKNRLTRVIVEDKEHDHNIFLGII